MVFSMWKNCLKFKQELHAMEEQALHFRARNLFCKVSATQVSSFSCVLYDDDN